MTQPPSNHPPSQAEEPLNQYPQHQPRSRQHTWLFLFIGLAVGLAAALTYAWVLDPVQFYDTEPVDLRAEHKETWILLVAATYRQDGDLERALTRLRSLDDPQIGRTVAQITEQRIQAGQSATQIRALVALADALGARTESMLIYLATPEPTLFLSPTPPPPTWTPTASPTPTELPTATPTPLPTATASPTPTATPTARPTLTREPSPTAPPPYRLQDQERLCQTGNAVPVIEIFVETEEGAGIPGREIWITWSQGVDRFVTGLKPEIGLGYADFQMQPDTTYNVGVSDPQLVVVEGLEAEPCPSRENNDRFASWRLVIVAVGDTLTPTPTLTPRATATPTAPATPTATPSELIP